jgi:hypothetical protein
MVILLLNSTELKFYYFIINLFLDYHCVTLVRISGEFILYIVVLLLFSLLGCETAVLKKVFCRVGQGHVDEFLETRGQWNEKKLETLV